MQGHIFKVKYVRGNIPNLEHAVLFLQIFPVYVIKRKFTKGIWISFRNVSKIYYPLTTLLRRGFSIAAVCPCVYVLVCVSGFL